jgi:hypothetical protein
MSSSLFSAPLTRTTEGVLKGKKKKKKKKNMSFSHYPILQYHSTRKLDKMTEAASGLTFHFTLEKKSYKRSGPGSLPRCCYSHQMRL